MAIEITCSVESYDDPVQPSILVQSHWNDDKMVVIEIGDEKRSIMAKDLKAAIDNATNTARF